MKENGIPARQFSENMYYLTGRKNFRNLQIWQIFTQIEKGFSPSDIQTVTGQKRIESIEKYTKRILSSRKMKLSHALSSGLNGSSSLCCSTSMSFVANSTFKVTHEEMTSCIESGIEKEPTLVIEKNRARVKVYLHFDCYYSGPIVFVIFCIVQLCEVSSISCITILVAFIVRFAGLMMTFQILFCFFLIIRNGTFSFLLTKVGYYPW